MRTGPRRPTVPSVRVGRPYVAPTRATSCRPGWSRPTRTNGLPGVEGVAHQLEHRGALLEHGEQPAARLELVGVDVVEQGGCPADEERPAARRCQVDERRPQGVQEGRLARGQARVVDAVPQLVRTELHADKPLVQVLVRPRREPRVDGLVEREELLGDAAGRRDRHHHDERRLQHEHLDVPHRRRAEARRGHERQQASDAGEHLRRRLQRIVELAPHRREVEREPGGPRIDPSEHLLGVHVVAGARRDAPGRRVRMGEEPERLQLGELVANGRRREAEPGALDERLRADGLARRHVLLHHPPQDVALAFAQLGHLQGILREKLGRDAAAEEAAARGERELAGLDRAPDEAEPPEPVERGAVDGVLQTGGPERFVESETEQHALACARRVLERLELACGLLAARRWRRGSAAGSARSASAAPRPWRRRRCPHRGSRGRASSRGCAAPAGRDHRRRGRSWRSRTSGSRRS